MKLDDLKKLASHFYPDATPEQYEQLRQQMRLLGLDPDALYQELEMSDPYVQVHRDTSYSDATVQLHSHAFYEVLCCRNTCGAEYLVGTERYRLRRGDIIVVPPGVSHRPLLPPQMTEPYIRDVLWFSTEFVRLLDGLFPSQKGQDRSRGSLLRTAHTPWEHLGNYLLMAVEEAKAQKPGWNMSVMGNVITFLAQTQRAWLDEATVPTPAEKPELMDQVMAYIEAHLAQRITLEEIARHLYVSGSTISQSFRRKMGVSVYRYVTQRRLIAAKELIAQNVLLESVPEQVGFSDYSSFYRAFKQEYGISPRQFRKL